MKTICLIIFLVIATQCFSQETSILADSGKREFKLQAQSHTPDYSAANRILSNQVKLHPDNAELRYFLGYAIDRLNASDGGGIYLMNRELALEASKQFEEVIRLEPVYKGELISVDPYAKISSIWGSLAMSYLNRKLVDSAIWAFSEGRKRGGFMEPILEFNRQLLNSCDSNSILIVSGDIITIPIWYLQTMEGLRNDITAVDGNLIHSTWYPKYLRSVGKLKMSLSDAQIDTINYMQWEPRTIEITDPEDGSRRFSWEMRPTYMNDYILKGDRILMDIFRQNFFKRPVYFLDDMDSSYNLFLTPYLRDEGLVSRVSARQFNWKKDIVEVPKNLSTYNIDKLDKDDIIKSQDVVSLLNRFRVAYMRVISWLLVQAGTIKARELLDQMWSRFSKYKLPYASKDQESYYEHVYKELKGLR